MHVVVGGCVVFDEDMRRRRQQIQVDQVGVSDVAILTERCRIRTRVTLVHGEQIHLLVVSALGGGGGGAVTAAVVAETVLDQYALEQHHVDDGHYEGARAQHDQILECHSLAI